ncbi:MAG: RNA polymerase sigma factor [Bacteroidetes bacterium]|nr:RNA polymerase sigma factor [Bacteroidota bacterium]
MVFSAEIIKLRAGDEQAFRELVNQYRDRVFNTALGLLQHHENAEDITQEVFVEVFRSIARFRGDCSLSTWIYRITVQKALEHIRKSMRMKRSGVIFSLFGREDQVNVSTDTPFYHPGIQLENKERSAILFKSIALLPVNQRTAFILHKVEGLSHTEIAEIMTVSVSSVESLMVRALRKLRELLSDYYEKNER